MLQKHTWSLREGPRFVPTIPGRQTAVVCSLLFCTAATCNKLLCSKVLSASSYIKPSDFQIFVLVALLCQAGCKLWMSQLLVIVRDKSQHLTPSMLITAHFLLAAALKSANPNEYTLWFSALYSWELGRILQGFPLGLLSSRYCAWTLI